MDDFTLPIGDIEILREGSDLSLVSYGTPLYTCSESNAFLVVSNLSVSPSHQAFAEPSPFAYPVLASQASTPEPSPVYPAHRRQNGQSSPSCGAL